LELSPVHKVAIVAGVDPPEEVQVWSNCIEWK
jgi:hypothetical protein